MGRKRQIKDSNGATSTMMVYAPDSLKSAFDDMCKIRGFSRSERIRDLMTKDMADWKGEAYSTDFDYEGKKRELRKLLKDEDGLTKDLQKEQLDTKRSAYEELCIFAASFGSDETLTENSDQVLSELYNYNYTGREVFSKNSLEMFIQMYEIVLRRRELQIELDAHRKNGLHSEDGVLVEAPEIEA